LNVQRIPGGPVPPAPAGDAIGDILSSAPPSGAPPVAAPSPQPPPG
jgi:hypothetical protein